MGVPVYHRHGGLDDHLADGLRPQRPGALHDRQPGQEHRRPEITGPGRRRRNVARRRPALGRGRGHGPSHGKDDPGRFLQLRTEELEGPRRVDCRGPGIPGNGRSRRNRGGQPHPGRQLLDRRVPARRRTGALLPVPARATGGPVPVHQPRRPGGTAPGEDASCGDPVPGRARPGLLLQPAPGGRSGGQRPPPPGRRRWC